MQPEYLATLKDAARWENRKRVLRLTLKNGEVLLANIISMPCECGQCTDDSVFYEHVSSSVAERNRQWEDDKKSKNVGGYGISLSDIEKAEIAKEEEGPIS